MAKRRGWKWDAANSRLSIYVDGTEVARLDDATNDLRLLVNGLTIDAGGLTITAGGLTIAAGGGSVTGGLTLPSGDLTLTAGQEVAGSRFTVPYNFAAADTTDIFFIAPAICVVKVIKEIHAVVAGQAGTMTVERLQGTEAPGSGDDLVSTTKFDLTATINTIQTATLTTTTAHLTLAAGDRLCLKVAAGAWTSLANACVVVELEWS